jgi:hypothetical protein
MLLFVVFEVTFATHRLITVYVVWVGSFYLSPCFGSPFFAYYTIPLASFASDLDYSSVSLRTLDFSFARETKIWSIVFPTFTSRFTWRCPFPHTPIIARIRPVR